MSKPNLKAKPKVIVVGGGTGGHVTPALAVACALQKQGASVSFIGSLDGPEEGLVRQAGYEFVGIHSGKLRRYFSVQNIIDFGKVIIGFFQARNLLARLKPDIVFAKGGYVSLPVVYAASFLEIPVVAHESDVVMGLANRLNAEKAELVGTGFPVDSYPAKLRAKLRFTGNPIHERYYQKGQDLTVFRQKLGLVKSRPIVVVIGGSQGARGINQFIFDSLTESLAEFQLIHLTGALDFDQAIRHKAALESKLSKSYLPLSYVSQNLDDYLRLADLVVSRSGANILAELAALGKAAIVIPLSSAAGDHQSANAKAYEKQRAVVVLRQDELTPAKLRQAIGQLLAKPERRRELARSIQFFRSPKAAEIIAEQIMTVVQ